MRIVKALSLAFLIAIFFSSLSFAAQQDRISGSLGDGQIHVLKGNVRHQARPEYDQGRVDPGMRLGTMTLLTAPTAAQESAIQQLLAQQQDRKSPNYHKWITPEQYADRFGLSQNDMQQLVAWLSAQGFTMIEPAHGRNFITFTGTAAQVESAFGTEIRHYNVKGEQHYANATAPQIPAAFAGIVTGVRGLDDFHPRPMGVRHVRPDYYYNGSQFSGQFIAPGDIYTIYDMNPLLTASPKIDGTGQKVAIMGATDIYLSDLNDFRTGFGLPTISCTAGTPPNDVITACSDVHFSYVLGGADPGLVGGDTLEEADLDLEWSGATAPGAQLIFVNSTDAFTSFYYAIDNKSVLGESVISLSFGLCEFEAQIGELHTGQPALFETELQKASSEGITFVNSSGDSGAAECDDNSTLTAAGLATGGFAVSYPASSPEVTGVGGTAVPLADLASAAGYWGTTNGPNGGSILPTGPENGYIPEQAWNDDDEFAQFCQEQTSGSPGYVYCQTGDVPAGSGWVPITSSATAQANFGIGADGGGASNCAVQNSGFTACVSGFPPPSWQTVTVSGQTTRMSPDISLLATPNFPGFIFCTQLSVLTGSGSGSSCAGGIASAVGNSSLIGGTSASAPIFAGMVALLNQYLGAKGPVGPINAMLYQLAATAPSAFHDITSGTNNAACEPNSPGAPQPQALWCPSGGVVGYSAGPGFDMATGLGSVDVNKLAVAFFSPPDFLVATTPPTTSLSVYAGQTSAPVTVTVTPVNNFSGPLSFSCSGLPTGSSCSFNPASVTPSGGEAATTTATVTAGSSATTGSFAIYATTSLGTSGTASHVSNASPSIALTVTSPFGLSLPTSSYQVTQGSSVNASVMVTIAGGFTGTITFTCSDPAPQSICTVPTPVTASTLPANGQVSFGISTKAPTASLRPPGRGTQIFYAALLPGLFGLMLTAGTRRRSLRGVRFLGLILVMGFSTIWLASCGGSSGGNSNPGTPVGPYTMTVSATSGSATVTSPSFTVNVTQ
jgi:subtilase family serine protease